MAEMIGSATGIVLAGGASRRFGSDKALAEWRGGQRLVERVCGVVSALFPETLVIVKQPSRFAFLKRPGVALRRDLTRRTHSLGGLRSALHHCRTERAFVSACDMPHLRPELVRALCEASAGYDAVVPVWDGRLEPLCAVYSRSCLGVLGLMAREGRLRVRELFGIVRTRFFQEHEVRRYDPVGASFRDVDTPEDLVRARKLA